MPPKLGTKQAEEANARDDLFAGAGPSADPDYVAIDPGQVALENQTIDQLVSTAVATHKDTTATANRALKVIEDTKQIQADTMKALQEQDRQMYEIDTSMKQMNEELSYAEKLLSYMRRCCCCWICDSCTGADPEDKRKKEWKKKVDQGKTDAAASKPGPLTTTGSMAKTGSMARGQASSAAPASSGAGPSGGIRDPDIRLPEDYRSTEMSLHEETRKQNDAIDQIHQGLEQLLDGAKNITDELSRQNGNLDVLDNKAAITHSRIEDMNKNSQLRNMARKPAKK